MPSIGATAAERKPAPGAVAGASATERTASREANSVPLSELPVLSEIIPENSPVPPLMLGVVALVAVVLGALLLIALVLRFLRQSWEP